MRDWLKANAIVILSGLLAVALAVAAFGMVRIYGFSVGPLHFEGLQAKADRFKGEVANARATAELSEGLRAQEQAQDTQSFTSAAERCEARVATARDAATTIGEIVNAPVTTTPSPAVGADRAIVPAAQLRRIIGQGGVGAAAGLPPGSDSTGKH